MTKEAHREWENTNEETKVLAAASNLLYLVACQTVDLFSKITVEGQSAPCEHFSWALGEDELEKAIEKIGESGFTTVCGVSLSFRFSR